MLESRLLPSLSSIKRFSARDTADLCFLYVVALHTLRVNPPTQDWARRYAQRTKSNWYAFSGSNTDLHQLLSVLLDHRSDLKTRAKDPRRSTPVFDSIALDDYDVQRFLQNVQSSRYDESLARQLLMRFENQLRITVTNYRSVRRITSDWTRPHVTHEAKSLAVTRLIQALETRARNGDVLPLLKQLAKIEQLLIKDACNPETGENCETPTPKMGLLKQLAIATGIGVGAFMLGRALAKGMNE